MSIARLLSCTLAALLATSSALACPCSDDAGAGTSLARADERYAVALVGSSRRALGRFDVSGDYRALPDDEVETSEELLLRVAARAPERLEWLADLGFASYRFHAGSFSERERGVGDLLLRGRYTLREEAMPHQEPRWPSLAATALLRAPLGALAQSRSSGFGSGGAQLGLGAWEAGLGLDLARSELGMLDWFISTEAAYRFEDSALGRARQLGPRADAWLGARVRAERLWATSLALRARFTGSVKLDGRALEGTRERLLSLVWGISFQKPASGFRSSATITWDPPLPRLSASSTSAVALGLALGYGVR